MEWTALADRLSPSAWYTVAAFAAGVFSYVLAELRRIQRDRSHAAQAIREREKRATSVTLVIDDMIMDRVAGCVKDAINANMGQLRRQIDSHVGNLDLALRTNLGRANEDREVARADRMADKLLKEEMRSEVIASRKALQEVRGELGKATIVKGKGVRLIEVEDEE